MSNQAPIFSLTATNYPTSILLGTKSYSVSFNASNNSSGTERFQIKFVAEGLDIQSPPEFNQGVEIGANQTISFSIFIRPITNGCTRLIIQGIHNKIVQYTEMVWKVRPKIDNHAFIDALSQQFYAPKNQLTQDKSLSPQYPSKVNISIEQANQELIATDMLPNQEEKDWQYADIAKRVFNSNYNLAFSITGKIQDKSLQQNLIVDFIPPLARMNITLAVSKLNTILDMRMLQGLIERIIIGLAEVNTKEAINLTNRISDPKKREELLGILVGFYVSKNPIESLPLISSMKDVTQQIPLYYEAVKGLIKLDPNKTVEVLNHLVSLLMQYKNISILKHSIALIGYLVNPQSSVDLIEKLDPDSKNTVNKDLFKYLFEQQPEQKTKIEMIPVFQNFIAFNCAAQTTKAIEIVGDIGGNISENLLIGDFSSFIGILCPFSFNFPIFPVIERCYQEIKMEKGKSFYYLLAPTRNLKSEEEFSFIQNMFSNWFVKNANNFTTKVYLFNLDFIPYLAKPTIIMGSDLEENLVIKSVVERTFADRISFIIDEGLFKGGLVHKYLNNIVANVPNKFKFINIVMTYDFLNDYLMFKQFISEFIK